MDAPAVSTTEHIVRSLTRAIVDHRLQPGAKLAEQKLAMQFGVSRTLVRQALLQLSQHGLIRLEPARGAFVAAPPAQEAREVFAVRRMIEVEMTREFMRACTPAKIKALRAHVEQERVAIEQHDAPARTELLGDFHVRMAELTGNEVLAQMLGQLVSRCSLISLMYQSEHEARHSHDEHAAIIEALTARDEARAVALMRAHLQNVEAGLQFDRFNLHTPHTAAAETCQTTNPANALA
jgi:DNA-binding GntR family transcriptional regulator